MAIYMSIYVALPWPGNVHGHVSGHSYGNVHGMDMARANNNVLMPRAPFTSLSTRPILATRTTRSNVGDTKYLSIRSLRRTPENSNILEFDKF